MRSGKGWVTLGQVWDVSGDYPECPGRFVGSAGRSGMGRGTLGDLRDRSGRPRMGRNTLVEVRNGSRDPW